MDRSNVCNVNFSSREVHLYPGYEKVGKYYRVMKKHQKK